MKTCLMMTEHPLKPKWLHSCIMSPARNAEAETTWRDIVMGVLGASVAIYLFVLVIQGLFTVMKLILN
jgi:hypothetical protein